MCPRTAKRARVLIVDDEPAMRDACRQVIERDGIRVAEAAGGAEALDRLAKEHFDLVILDLKMPGIDGISVLKSIRHEHPDTAVVVVTGYPSVESAVEAMKSGAIDFLPKPFTRESLSVIIERALHVPTAQTLRRLVSRFRTLPRLRRVAVVGRVRIRLHPRARHARDPRHGAPHGGAPESGPCQKGASAARLR